jgi:hypothetical protein
MGGGGKTPDLPATPAPTPMPTQPTSTQPIQTEGQRAANIAKMKRGILSTIRTSPAGVSGTGSDLGTNQTGRRTLGGS